MSVDVRCEPDPDSDGVIVHVHGALDLDAEQQLVDEVELALASATGAVLDLGAVEFIDSSGVRALLRLRRAHEGRVRLGPLARGVQRVLDIAGVVELFERADDPTARDPLRSTPEQKGVG